MKKTLLCLVLVPALLLFAAPALGASSLPKPKSLKAVVPTSLAGIKLGMSEAAAKAAWGERGTCATSTYSARSRCEYGDTSGPTGSALIECADAKVIAVVIYSGRNAANVLVPSATGVLGTIKTSDGLGIGSKFSAVKSAYPKGAVEAGGETSNYAIDGKGAAEFVFGVLAASKKVYSVALRENLAP
jgi:hypothetical protein